VKVPEDKLRSVVFLVDGGVPRATGFLVAVTEGEVMFPYVVTARHCVEETAGRDFHIRINIDDRHDDLPTNADDWLTHDSADVAAILFEGKPGNHYHLYLERPEHFVDADYAIDANTIWSDQPMPAGGIGFVGQYDYEKHEYVPSDRVFVGVGDDLFFVSLLYDRPMTRMIEGPKIGNQPVFVPDQGYVMRLLGLVSGHWDIKQKAETVGDIVGTIRTAINSGIAVVTPAEAIRELLMREDVVEDRKKLADEFMEREERSRAMTPDSASEPTEYERFEDLSRRLLSVPKTELDEARKRETE
jgi:hypothetical protein